MENAINPTPTKSVHGKKRSAAQRTADLEFIEGHVLRGRTQTEIAELLSASRPYCVSRSQVSYDVDTLKQRWLESAGEAVATSKARALRMIDAIERELWEAWEQSKAGGTAGNPTFLTQLLNAHDRRAKLLGLDAPAKNELSGPAGGPVQVNRPLSDEEAHRILRRHYERMKWGSDWTRRHDDTATDETAEPSESSGTGQQAAT